MELVDGADQRREAACLPLAFRLVAHRLSLPLYVRNFAGDEPRQPRGQRLRILRQFDFEALFLGDLAALRPVLGLRSRENAVVVNAVIEGRLPISYSARMVSQSSSSSAIARGGASATGSFAAAFVIVIRTILEMDVR